MRTRRNPLCAVVVCAIVFAAAGPVAADWTETNKDGTPGGGLDYLANWYAVFNGAAPDPATTWDTAGNLAGVYGTDPGWVGNVVHITDADATAYAAVNNVESFTDVKASVAVSVEDLTEEFGLLVRSTEIDWSDDITDVSAYAATFSANGALTGTDPTLFSLYKIDSGVIDPSKTQTANVAAGDFTDLISFIELSAMGSTVTAKLYDDADSTSPLATLSFADSTYTSGYTGVIDLDLDSAGIGSYWDTLDSQVVPEPATITLLVIGAVGLIRRRRQ